MNTSFDFIHRDGQSKGVFYIPGKVRKRLAEITYSKTGKKYIVIEHTFVTNSLRGKEIGEMLVNKVVKLAEDQNKKIIPICPYANKLMRNDSAYNHILA
ncbi:GNAT family N-acetyltransferase [Mangrovivirga sp. M17]|uniref:GNAT family N-acetyltransferase n=1 Tax=Mangrovivirga halotolerans TaxID=2993936 RepID=A0ABT3RS83_9BACT|nr:GNAT family N-acetyltransferase [Mangrovivirga halotolerans]MCX2744208.1 GNAT family N-acetyltransferase [Mangrovivirga halotolerans]